MKKVLVYCATGYAEKVTYSLNDEVYEVIGYIDGNPETWGGTCAGKCIYPPPEK